MQSLLVLSLGAHWNRLGCYVRLGLIRFGPWSKLGQVWLLGKVRFGSSVGRGGAQPFFVGFRGGGWSNFLQGSGGGTFFSPPEGVFICTNWVIIAMSLSVGSIYNGYIGLCHKTNLILLSKCWFFAQMAWNWVLTQFYLIYLNFEKLDLLRDRGGRGVSNIKRYLPLRWGR